MASRALNVLLTDTLDRLEPLSGSITTRRKIINDLGEPLETFARSHPEDFTLQFAWSRLLSLQADVADADTQFDDAERLRGNAERVLRELERAGRDAARVRRDLSTILAKQGDAKARFGDRSGALATYYQALEIDEALSRALPDDAATLDALVWSYLRCSFAAVAIDNDASRRLLDKYVDAAGRLYELDPERPGSIYAKLEMMAQLSTRASGTPTNDPLVRDSNGERLNLGRKLLRVAPGVRAYVIRHATDLVFTADQYRRATRFDESIALCEQADAAIASLDTADREATDLRTAAGAVLRQRMLIASDRGDRALAREHAMRVVALSEKALTRFATAADAPVADRLEAGVVLELLACIDAELGDHAAAAASLHRAVAILMPRRGDPEAGTLIAAIAGCLLNANRSVQPDWRFGLELAGELDQRFPNEPAVLLLRALSIRTSGDENKAREMLHSVRDRVDPQTKTYHFAQRAINELKERR
jgi:tetratricopeptide (TPR) repeat protein